MIENYLISVINVIILFKQKHIIIYSNSINEIVNKQSY